MYAKQYVCKTMYAKLEKNTQDLRMNDSEHSSLWRLYTERTCQSRTTKTDTLRAVPGCTTVILQEC